MKVVVELPDKYFLDASAEELGDRLKLSTALLMFKAGELSAGAACEFAGVDRYTFYAACKSYKIAVNDYDEDELESEFDELRRDVIRGG